MSLVSVILPTRNRCKLLGRAVHSVLAQTHHELELIVVDDGSTDRTADVLDAIVDTRIRRLRNERPAGASGARNRGLAEARGAFVAFQDDDDIWLVERLEGQLAHLRTAGDGVALSICGHFCLDAREPRYVGGAKAFRGIDFSKGMTGDWSLIATPGWLVPRGILELAGGFDERLRVFEDWDLALRLSRVGRIVHCSEPLFVHDVSEESLMRDSRAVADAVQVLMEKHGKHERWTPTVASDQAFLIGRMLCAASDLREGRRWLWHAIAANLGNLPAWGCLLGSLFGGDAVRWLTRLGRRSRGLVTRMVS